MGLAHRTRPKAAQLTRASARATEVVSKDGPGGSPSASLSHRPMSPWRPRVGRDRSRRSPPEGAQRMARALSLRWGRSEASLARTSSGRQGHPG